MASMEAALDSGWNSAGTAMTRKLMVEICQRHDGYRTPEVNDKLYLHSQGFRRLDPEVMKLYTGLRCLWLQGNGLERIEGLDDCVEIRNLLVHENCIDEISGLENLVDLDSLNISKNFVKKIAGLGSCPKLTNLNLGHNSLGPDVDSIEAAGALPALQTLDLQCNRLEDGEAVLDLLKKIKTLRVFYGQGNPFVKSFRHYRKRFVAALPNLTYLDDRPVFPHERRRCEAWAVVWAENQDLDAANAAEREEIKTIKLEKKLAEEKRIKAFEDMITEARAEHQKTEAAKRAAGRSFSNEPIVGVGELYDENADPNAPPPAGGFVDEEELD